MAQRVDVYGGRWRIVKWLGRGGQGQVYEVNDQFETAGDSTYAMKVVEKARRGIKRARFVREVTACKKLKHPNIIPIVDHSDFESATQDSELFMVMPLLSGSNLESRLMDFHQDIGKVVNLGIALVSALMEAHSKGVIHRDLKPANILFASPDSAEPIISDFGICLLSDSERLTEDRHIVGPRIYMAPELETGGQLDVDESCDLYSLGKVLCFAFANGYRIFREDTLNLPFNQSGNPKESMLAHLIQQLVRPLSDREKDKTAVLQRLRYINQFGAEAIAQIPGNAIRNAVFVAEQKEKERLAAVALEELAKREAIDYDQIQKALQTQVRQTFEKYVRDLQPILHEIEAFENGKNTNSQDTVKGFDFTNEWEVGIKYGKPRGTFEKNYRHYLKARFGRVIPNRHANRQGSAQDQTTYIPPRYVLLMRYVTSRADEFYIPFRIPTDFRVLWPPVQTSENEQVLCLIGTANEWTGMRISVDELLQVAIEWFMNWLSQEKSGA